MSRKRIPGGSVIMLVAVLLVAALVGTFAAWWHEFSAASSPSTAFRLFVYSLVATNVFLLASRAYLSRGGYDG